MNTRSIGRMTAAGLAWMAVLAVTGSVPAPRPAPGPVAITPQAAYEVAPDLPAPLAQAVQATTPAR